LLVCNEFFLEMTFPLLLNDFDSFLKLLDRFPVNDLPGLDAQLRMAPDIRREEISRMGKESNAVKSSVLFLFYPLPNGSTATVFIQRPIYAGSHSGQISFPGGRYEKTDHGLDFTALRETHEEIGVQPDKIEIKGRLSDLYIPPSNYIVSPFIGICRQQPVFRPDPKEVSAIIEVELQAFFEKQNIVTKTFTLPTGYSFQTPCYSINGYIIWGATAMIISEFKQALRQVIK
jgi:8-oxo-dGTP pyrophosphatase MutT (NUDIX family)